MKYLVFLLFFLVGTAEACRPRHYTDEQRFEKAQFIFTAKSISAKTLKGDEVLIPYEPIEYSVVHDEIIKGKEPPNTITLAGCGAGSAEIGEISLFFVERYNSRWHGYAVTESHFADNYSELLAKVKLLATNKKQNIDAPKDGAN